MKAQFIATEERYVLNEMVMASHFIDPIATTPLENLTQVATQRQAAGYTIAASSGAQAFSATSSGSDVVVHTMAAREGWITVTASFPKTAQVVSLSGQFETLRRRWKEQTLFVSSIHQIILCEPYQRIIGMGESVLPLIFAELRREGDQPSMWFWALEAITHENPVPEESWKDIRAAARIWLEWAAAHGFVA